MTGDPVDRSVKAVDWDHTPLGHRLSWPPSLRTLANLMTSSVQPMFLAWGLERTLIYNEDYAPLLGLKHPNSFGRPFFEVWSEVAEELGPLFDQVFRGEAVQMDRIDLVLDRGKGPKEANFSFSYTPVLGEAGDVVGLFCACSEITGQIVAERESAILRRSEGLLAAVVASSDDAIISKTADGTITSWNMGAERLFGYSAEEALGNSISMLAMAGREDEMPSILHRLRRGERVEHFEAVRRKKDGSAVYVSLTASPIHDQDGAIVGASKVARDITEVRASAEALKQAQERLQTQYRELLHAARLGELGQLAATLAHEINQPLSAIVNYLAAVQRLIERNNPTDRPMINEAVRRATDQAVRAAEVVRRQRLFARPNEGMMKLEAINQIIEEATALSAIDSGRSGVTVGLVLDPKAGLVLADRIELQQVVLNLVRNALDALATAPRKVLTLSTIKMSDQVQVVVADSGNGLAAEVREHLFQPFFTTKGTGMGIGLSICQKIIQAHGGVLWAEESSDSGAVFRFALPCHGRPE